MFFSHIFNLSQSLLVQPKKPTHCLKFDKLYPKRTLYCTQSVLSCMFICRWYCNESSFVIKINISISVTLDAQSMSCVVLYACIATKYSERQNLFLSIQIPTSRPFKSLLQSHKKLLFCFCVLPPTIKKQNLSPKGNLFVSLFSSFIK